MSKSLRSKRKRKFRAIKREKNAPKELAKLKKAILNLENCEDVKRYNDNAIEYQTPTPLIEVVNVFDKISKRNSNGHYPKWMNQRAIKKSKANCKRYKLNSKAKLSF